LDRPRLAILIPAFREAATIGKVVAAAREHGDVIVVDDASPDATAEQAAAAGAIVVRNERNRGYDGTLNRAFEEAVKRGYTHAVTMDADGEHDPALVGTFKTLLMGDGVALVLGVRPRKQRFAEIVMGLYVRLRFGVADILCGMKGYDLKLAVANDGFDHTNSIGTELAINSLRRGAGLRQVPVSGTRRQDAPRFDRLIRANLRIFAALGHIIRDDAKHLFGFAHRRVMER
jgi:glycosyltransferase involved in cell wall biosynthesis